MLKREHFENGYLEIFPSSFCEKKKAQIFHHIENYVNMSPIKNSTQVKK